MQKGEVLTEEIDHAQKERLLAERMDRVRTSGRVLILVGSFLISLANTLRPENSGSLDFESNAGFWFGR